MSEPGFLATLPEPPRKVALVRASRIGDFVCAVPAFRALRANLPGAEISLITLPMLRGVAERTTMVDRIIDFPGYPGIASQFFEARKAARFFADMQAENFDLAVQMHGSGVYANPFTLMLGAKKTVGFIRPGDPADRLDAALPFPQRGHEIDRLLALTEFLGCKRRGRRTEFPLWDEDWDEADALLAGAAEPFIGLHPAANHPARRWPPERFAETGKALAAQYGGTLVILAGPDEVETAAKLEGLLAGAPVRNLAGKTTLPGLGGVILKLKLLVTNDSGPAHIAYAIGTPSVTAWGAEDLERYGPPGPKKHRVAISPEGSVETLPVHSVLEACDQVWE